MSNGNDLKELPIPVCGVPSNVRPCIEMPIELYWNHRDGINWERGQSVTKAQLESAIKRSGGQRLPNDHLPALDPGDVVVLHDGIFWIDRNWSLQELKKGASIWVPQL